MKKTARKPIAEDLRNRLKLKSLDTRLLFNKKHPHADKFFKYKGLDLGKIREHSAKILSSGAIAGALLLSPPNEDLRYLPTPQEMLEKFGIGDSNKTGGSAFEEIDKKKVLVESLKNNLPSNVKPLSGDEEKLLEQIFGHVLGISAKANLEGEHLNTTYGYIGAEQHLRRFPNDNISLHGEKEIQKEGMAPGLGAWGYFSGSKGEFTKNLEENEKWYAVVQTLYLPDWDRRQPYLKNWYKFRKVLIVNTLNGNAVVADVADSGPAAWTGKHYGGSPEVMEYLGGLKYKKGPVIVFFVDDPDNKIPLGPVEYN